MTTEPVFGRTVLSMSGAEHRANRTLVSAPVIEPVINELIDRFAHRGSADLVAEFTKSVFAADHQPPARYTH